MAKFAAKGIQLAHLTGSTYTTVVGLESLSFGLGTTEQIDVTTHDSAGSYREFVSGLIEADDVTAVLVYDPANATQEFLRAQHAAGTANGYKITLPDSGNATFTFSANVTVWSSPDNPVSGGALKCSVTLKPTGAMTFAA